MLVHFSAVGEYRETIGSKKVNMPVVPREGEQVVFLVEGREEEVTVRTVVWHPFPPEPYAYVVVGPRRRSWSD